MVPPAALPQQVQEGRPPPLEDVVVLETNVSGAIMCITSAALLPVRGSALHTKLWGGGPAGAGRSGAAEAACRSGSMLVDKQGRPYLAFEPSCFRLLLDFLQVNGIATWDGGGGGIATWDGGGGGATWDGYSYMGQRGGG